MDQERIPDDYYAPDQYDDTAFYQQQSEVAQDVPTERMSLGTGDDYNTMAYASHTAGQSQAFINDVFEEVKNSHIFHNLFIIKKFHLTTKHMHVYSKQLTNQIEQQTTMHEIIAKCERANKKMV